MAAKQKVELFAKSIGFVVSSTWYYKPVTIFRKPVFELTLNNLRIQVNTEFGEVTLYEGDEIIEVSCARKDDDPMVFDLSNALIRIEEYLMEYYEKQNKKVSDLYLTLSNE
jgi:hypothetical protein